MRTAEGYFGKRVRYTNFGISNFSTD